MPYYDPTTAEYLDPSVTRKVAVITGGTTGIGWYTILHLYLHGYVVYIAARDPIKVQKAITIVKIEATNRNSGHPVGELHYVEMDLMLLLLVSQAAEKLAMFEPKIDILINNAGIMAVKYALTEDGHEVQRQVNFVGHMLLTMKLLPQLEASPAARVVFVSLAGHNFAYRYFDPTDNIEGWPDALWTWVRYGNAKAAQIHFVRYMAREHPRILWLAVHPGTVAGTNMLDAWKQNFVLRLVLTGIVKAVDYTVGITNEEGLLSTLRAALDPELLAESDNGVYLLTGGVELSPLAMARSGANARQTVEYYLQHMKETGFL